MQANGKYATHATKTAIRKVLYRRWIPAYPYVLVATAWRLFVWNSTHQYMCIHDAYTYISHCIYANVSIHTTYIYLPSTMYMFIIRYVLLHNANIGVRHKRCACHKLCTVFYHQQYTKQFYSALFTSALNECIWSADRSCWMEQKLWSLNGGCLLAPMPMLCCCRYRCCGSLLLMLLLLFLLFIMLLLLYPTQQDTYEAMIKSRIWACKWNGQFIPLKNHTTFVVWLRSILLACIFVSKLA